MIFSSHIAQEFRATQHETAAKCEWTGKHVMRDADGRRCEGSDDNVKQKNYTDATVLGRAVRQYFRSISRTVPITDAKGQPICSDDGKTAQRVEYLSPPSLADLCLYLGIDRATFESFRNSKRYPAHRAVISWVDTKMEAYLEEELLTRHTGFQGIQYRLQSRVASFPFEEEAENQADKSTSLSLSEKLALIEEARNAADGQ